MKRFIRPENLQIYIGVDGVRNLLPATQGRMDLEHCSGQTVEAVQQDFAATVLLSNVESVVIGPAAEQLSVQTIQREQPVKINRAVSMHALKTRLIDLLASQIPPLDFPTRTHRHRIVLKPLGSNSLNTSSAGIWLASRSINRVLSACMLTARLIFTGCSRWMFARRVALPPDRSPRFPPLLKSTVAAKSCCPLRQWPLQCSRSIAL